MLLELVQGLLAFDLEFFVSIILSNLHWLFIFATLYFILSNGKSLIPGMFFLMFILFSMRSIIHSLLDWKIIILAFPLFFVAIGILVLRIFLEGTHGNKYMVPLTVLFIFLFTFLNQWLFLG